jgi:hypothetical protein
MPRPVANPVASVAAVLSFVVLFTACGGGGAPGPADTGIVVANVGFMTPESVLHDSIADVYLVSNINGGPVDEDDNGFISRVTPDGEVENLKWIDGASNDVVLNAPKGMAIRGDTLYVADIKCIRRYNRTTGESITSTCYDTMSFLNDIAVGGANQSLFVTDTGVDGNFQPTGTEAVYRMEDREGQQGVTLASGPNLGGPNGVAVGSRGIFVVTYASGEVLRFTPTGEKTVVATIGQPLDGVVMTNDGGFAFSSWGDSSVTHVNSMGQINKVAVGVEAPADIGYDKKRNRILIPLFNANEIRIVDLSPPDPTG